MAREKMPEFKRKGNWKNAPGSQAATKKTRGVATTEAVKKMKQKESMAPKPKAKPAAAKPKIGAGVKPKPKPESVKAKSYKRTGKVAPEPSEAVKKYIPKYKDRAKKGFILDPKYNPPLLRARLARSGTSEKAGRFKQAKRAKSEKPQSRSGSMVLGQGRSSPAAKKLKRTVGYGR